MMYVLDKAREGYDERLALFNIPPVETAIQETYYKDYRPVGQISGKSTLEFEVYNNSADYIILSQISLLLTLQMLTDKGVPITSADDVSLVNFAACTAFTQQDLPIQHQLITSSIGSNFGYKAMFDILLKYGRNEQLSWMSLAGFHKDTKGLMDNCEPKDSANNGLGARYTKTKDGKKVMYKTKLFMDICQQNRFLLGNLPINLKLYPATDKHRLTYKNVAEKFYSLNILDATLIIPFAKIHPGMLTAQAEVLKKEMALYPFIRSEIKAYNIATSSFNWTMDNLFQDSIPKRLIVAFLVSASYSGDNEKKQL